MNAKSITMGIIGITVAVLITMSVVAPILADSTAETETVRNDGYIRMKHVEDDDDTEYVIIFNTSTPNFIKVNDVEVPITNLPSSSIAFNVIFDTNWLIKGYSPDDKNYITSLQFYTTSGDVVSLSSNVSITCQSGQYSITNLNTDTVTRTGTYTDLYIPDVDGYYIMKDRDKPAHVKVTDEMIGYGLTAVKSAVTPDTVISPGLGLSVIGTIEDGIEITTWRSVNGYTATFSNETINYSESDRWVDVYDVSSITFVATTTYNSDTTLYTDNNVTYSYFLVPYEFTAEKTIHPDQTTITILETIPIMILIAIVIGVIALISYRRM